MFVILHRLQDLATTLMTFFLILLCSLLKHLVSAWFNLYRSLRRRLTVLWVVSSLYWYVFSLTTRWTSGRSGFDPRQGQRVFPLASVSRPALGPTQPPVHWVPGGPFPGGKSAAGAWCWPLTPRGREWVRAIPPLPPSVSTACSGTALPTFLSL
jgi:hypothetical protein